MFLTDYLVVGAGAASMAFIDTLLTEQPTVNIAVVDKHDAPGGHWNDSYAYVHLHQPSLLYGVASRQLEGNWLRLLLQKWTLPWNHRASQHELLEYYKSLMDGWVSSGRVQYYPGCMYDFEKSKSASDQNIHFFHKLDKSVSHQIQVNEKLVNGVMGECQIPATCPPKFSVADGIPLVTPNELCEKESPLQGKFVVIGCGKTAMDAVIYLQSMLKVPASEISWVISNDVWMLRRTGDALPLTWPAELLAHDLNVNATALSMERRAQFVRLDNSSLPTRFRYAVIGDDEVSYLQKISNTIRQGRITSIRCATESKDAVVHFQEGDPLMFEAGTTFIHCTSPGPFNGKTFQSLFPSDNEMILGPLFAPPLPMSMSTLAFLEARRRAGTVNVELGRKLMAVAGVNNADVCSATDILSKFINGWAASENIFSPCRNQVDTLVVTAAFVSLVDKDPMVGLNFMKTNRLSSWAIPGQKTHVYESMLSMIEKQEVIGMSDEEVKVVALLADHLKVIKGM